VVDLFDSVPILVYLALLQWNIGSLRMFRIVFESMSIVEKYQDYLHRSFAFFVAILCQGFLANLFLLEAFALPFDIKQGKIAFSLLDGHGLFVSVFVVIGLFVVLGISLLCSHAENPRYLALLGAALSSFVLVLHSIVVVLWHWIAHWQFVNISLFFLSLEKEYMAYRLVRSVFSVLTIVESWFWFGFGNIVVRGIENIDRDWRFYMAFGLAGAKFAKIAPYN